MPSLQSLRFVFVMLIVMSHLALPGHSSFDAGGDCGVAFFFILSGFVLSYRYGPSLQDNSYNHQRFLRRRLSKLYPLHLLCLIAWLLINRQTIDLRTITNALLLQSWIPRDDYYFSCNAVSWFLSSLFFCYILFPFAWRRTSTTTTICLLLVCATAYALTPKSLIGVLYVHPLARFVDFFLGMMLQRFCATHRKVVLPVWTEWGLVLVLVLLLMVYPIIDVKLRNAPIFWVVLLPLIAVFATATGTVSRFLSHKPLQWLGSLSMPIFMTHSFVLTTLTPQLTMLPDALVIAFSLLIVILIGWATDRFVLRPISSFLQAIATRK